MEVKGFWVTIDAMLASLLVLTAAALFLGDTGNPGGVEQQFEVVKRQVLDNAEVGFLLGTAVHPPADPTWRYAYCGQAVKYNSTTFTTNPLTVCGGR